MQSVVLCAGSGIRLRPITDQIPKCMVQVRGKPLLEHVLTNMVHAGIDEIFLVVGYKRQIVEDYFGTEFLGVPIKYFVQTEPLGTAHAVSLVHQYIKGKFMVANGDVIASKNDYRELSRTGKTEDFDAIVLSRKVQEPWRFGVLKVNHEKIVDIIEKPNPGKEPTKIINAGIYRFSQDFMEAIMQTELSERGEYEIVDSIKIYIEKGKRVIYRMCNDTCIDISSSQDVNEANEMQEKDFPQ
ncbi:MAG TPA: sugar phosphate nucleotidyltransferase [archaeon]|nr:sugar phosphate nucleotidyltransferase [archaeon]